MVVIIDYGMGNVNSIANMLRKAGVEAVISSSANVIERGEKLILPGVGAFDKAMTNLENMGIIPLLRNMVLDRHVPIMGICLGLQLFANTSQEGVLPGLGWINGDVKKFRFEPNFDNLKVPHMGWNYIGLKKPSLLFDGLEENSRFYFVHSYHIVCQDVNDELTQTNYGCNFTSAIQRDNIIGVQFHPEKSHRFGLNLLKNFVRYF
jgi:glutamine amidotransferase